MGACVPAKITENVIMTHHRLNQRFTNFGGSVLDYRAGGAVHRGSSRNVRRADDLRPGGFQISFRREPAKSHPRP